MRSRQKVHFMDKNLLSCLGSGKKLRNQR